MEVELLLRWQFLLTPLPVGLPTMGFLLVTVSAPDDPTAKRLAR